MYGPSTQAYGTPSPTDPYRASPVQQVARQPYVGAPAYGNAPPRGGFIQSPPQQYAPSPAGYGSGAAVPHGQYAPAGYNGFQAQQPVSAPRGGGSGGQKYKGTLPPGQMVRVGQHTVRIERYLSEGGYAHVYLTSSDKPIYPPKRANSTSKGRWGERGYTEHCLKRIAFEDESVWADVSKEIEVMKALPPSPHLIQFLDSNHHRLPNGTHEVFILMEFCSGGGIIDLLNKRLRDRLKEIEILNIFTDVAEAVAAMHALSRPLLHRDLKIENVLSHPLGTGPTPQRPTPLLFKLCDFGSTTFPATHPPSSKAEADALAVDLNKHTTLQYRSPEMVEPMLGWAVGLPSDVWALGVLLYKLCYYTTPFEEHGTLAIVNAKYTFPQYPVYSPRLQHLIASMLVEHPSRRPTVYEVLKVAHEMSGTKPEVDYPTPSSRSLPAPNPTPPVKQNSNLLDFTDPSSKPAAPAPVDPLLLANIQPQRRGRPTRDSMQAQAPSSKAPPPQLPGSMAQQQPPSAVTGSSAKLSGLSRHHSVSANTPGLGRGQQTASKPHVPRLQVTGGDQPKRPQLTREETTDAFGVSTKTTATPSLGGFGDAFTTPVDAKASPSGSFGDAFGVSLRPTGKSAPQRSASGFSDSFAAPTSSRFPPPPTLPARAESGFSDSFNMSSRPLQALQQPKSNPSSSSGSQPIATSSAPVHDPPTKSSASNGELTFEQRFPSIDALSSGDATPPQVSPPIMSPPIVTSPQDPTPRRMSIANHTGGGMSNKHHAALALPPQPRSTHVTGTAFKSDNKALKPPLADSNGSPSPTADYLSLLDDEVENGGPKVPEDLMGDEGSESNQIGLAPLRPQLSANPSSGARFGVTPKAVTEPSTSSVQPSTRPQVTPNKPQGAAQRATLPPISATRPPSNFNSASWSPLEAMRSDKSKPVEPPSPSPPATAVPSSNSIAKSGPAGSISEDSSDDEQGPENVNGSRRRPTSPVRRGPSPGITRGMSGFESNSSLKSPATAAPRSPTKPASPMGSATNRSPRNASVGRPQSMFVGATGTSPSLSPPISGLPRSTSPAEKSGAHARRSSINDIVSRYESLKTSGPRSPGREGADPAFNEQNATSGVASVSANSLTRKQSTTAKPPTVAAKPAALRKPSGARANPSDTSPGAIASESRAPPATQPKPASLRPTNAATHGGGEERAPTGGREWPSGKADPVSVRPPASPSGASSRSSSPEKQQPVNMLIARWNQGDVKGKK